MSEGVAKSKDVVKAPSVAKSPGAAKSPRAKARSRAKWIVLGVLIAAVFLAVKLGFVGYGWAHLMAKVFPRDESLLRWFPGDTPAVLIVDPHQMDLGALGSEQSVLRTGRSYAGGMTGHRHRHRPGRQDRSIHVWTPLPGGSRGRFDQG